MKQAKVYYNHILAGTLSQLENGTYHFVYHPDYVANSHYPPISVHFPKTQVSFRSNILFPFFFNLLSEGANKRLQLQQYKIDDTEYIDLLIKTATYETIGAVTVGPA